jgi:hypothetical protein
MTIVSAVVSFAFWQGGPFLLFAELHPHPIASPWERNVVPSAQFG